MRHSSNMSEQLQENRRTQGNEKSNLTKSSSSCIQKDALQPVSSSKREIWVWGTTISLTSAYNWTSLYCEVPCTELGLCTEGTHADLADNYFLVCFTWLQAVRLKEYLHLSKTGFYLQQTLVNFGVGRTEEKSRWTTGVNAVYPWGNCITLYTELINACLKV